jgi:hypothetical protein
MALLGDLAHCRFGDKGDTGLYVVVPYDPADYPRVLAALSPARIAVWMGVADHGTIACMPFAELGALVIAIRSSLGGGVTASLALDAHGKTRSAVLLAMPILL